MPEICQLQDIKYDSSESQMNMVSDEIQLQTEIFNFNNTVEFLCLSTKQSKKVCIYFAIQKLVVIP